MTTLLDTPKKARQWCQSQRRQGYTIGYVPTMGGLHEGHRSLVDKAVAENDTACVSIFVNPLQFNSAEDYRQYPHMLDADLEILAESGCEMAFTGTLEEFFPAATDLSTTDSLAPLPAISGLEAEFRPGHLEGVQAIVEQLFRIVGASRAYFGEKDFQQVLLVHQIAASLEGIDVIVCPTIREPDGLALSTRNRRLSQTERALAQTLFRALQSAAAAWYRGVTVAKELEAIMWQTLAVPGIRVEYTAVRDPEHWTVSPPQGSLQQARALVAAWVGSVRLIDNLALKECMLPS